MAALREGCWLTWHPAREDLRKGFVLNLAHLDLVEVLQHVVDRRSWQDRVVEVVGVAVDVLPHPRSQRWPLSRHLLEQELLDALNQLPRVLAQLQTALQSAVHLVHDSLVVSLAEEDLLGSQLLYDWLALVVDVGPEEEPLLEYCVFLLTPCIVFLKFADGDVPIDLFVFVKQSHDQMQ